MSAASNFLEFHVRALRIVDIGLCAVALICNPLALVALRLGVKELQPKHRFLMNLHLSDMIIASTTILIELLAIYGIQWCNIYDMMFGVLCMGYSGMASTLACLGFDLYIAICHALRYDSIMTYKRVNITLVLSWTWSAIIGMSFILCRFQNMPVSGKTFCEESGMCVVFLVMFGSHCCLSSFLLLGFYFKVQLTVWRMSKTVQPSHTVSSQATSIESAKKAFLTIWLIEATMVVFLAPGFVAIFFRGKNSWPYIRLIYHICADWASLNCIADPIIHSFRMSDIRAGFKRLLALLKRR